MSVPPVLRNILIIAVIAAIIAFVPGGGTSSGVIVQAISMAFLATIVWLASLMYRQHRVALYSIGESRRAALYAAAAVLTITLTATNRLWTNSLGGVLWLILVGGSLYAGFAIIWAARNE